MLKKLVCIGLGAMMAVSLSSCGKNLEIREYDNDINVFDNAEVNSNIEGSKELDETNIIKISKDNY